MKRSKNFSHSFYFMFSSICLIFLVINVSSCNQQIPNEVIRDYVLEQIDSNVVISYRYKLHWDNRFNETKHLDSAEMTYVKMENAPHSFGFHATAYGNDYIFDGVNYKEFEHEEKTIVRHDKDEIREDANYFEGSSFLSMSPIGLLNDKEFESVFDASNEEKRFAVFKEVTSSKSVSDDTQMVYREQFIFLDKESYVVDQIRNITIKKGDTLQILDCYFSDYKFSMESYDFSSTLDSNILNYREIGIEDEDTEREDGQIKVGEKLQNKIFQDVSAKDVAIFGSTKKQSLVMFSFIGCGGCEYAMHDFFEKNYKFKEDIDFYYSSPVDKSSTLKSYLIKKEFPFKAFGSESKMNESFSVFSYPTFVLIDADGIVQKVIFGYDDEVRKLVFDHHQFKN